MFRPWIRKWLEERMPPASRRKGRRPARGMRSCPLHVEVLEDRSLLSSVTAIIAGPNPPAVQEGQYITLVGTATDTVQADQNAGFDYEWSVTDPSGMVVASQSTASMGSDAPDTFQFNPAEAGPYVVTLTATDRELSTSPPATLKITASDAPLHATPGPKITQDATGGPLMEWGSTGTVTLATFTDDNASAPPTDYTATIDWGDGTPATTGTWADGTIVPGAVQNGPVVSYSVQASHVYSKEGTYAIGVTIADVDGASVSLPGSNAPQQAVVAEPPLTPHQGFVDRLYEDLLHRPPDSAGLLGWSGALDAGTLNTYQVVLGIESSPEYRGDQVEGLYQTLLHRTADTPGWDAAVTFLQQGGTVEELQAAIMGSPEYYQVRGGGTDAGFMDAAVLDTIHRGATAGDLLVGTQLLAGGWTRTQMAAALVANGLAQADRVETWYQTYLGRAADPQGQAGFLAGLQMGVPDEVLVAAMLGSPEYVNKS